MNRKQRLISLAEKKFENDKVFLAKLVSAIENYFEWEENYPGESNPNDASPYFREHKFKLKTYNPNYPYKNKYN